MDDLTQLKIVDIYTGRIVRAKGRGDLKEWLINSYKTLTDQQQSMIDCLDTALELDDENGIKWYGAACGLEITPKKTRRKRS